MLLSVVRAPVILDACSPSRSISHDSSTIQVMTTQPEQPSAHAHGPGTHGRLRARVGHVNALGMNDAEIPAVKEAEERRVLVLGDSFVEARQVPIARNFCGRLARRLSDESGRCVRVMNAGVSSYSPIIEYVQYEQLRTRLQPDVVVLVLFANDIFDDLRYSALARVDEAGRPLGVPSGVPNLVMPGPDGEASRVYRRELARILNWRPWPARFSYVAANVGYHWQMWRLKRAFPTPPVNEHLCSDSSNPVFLELDRRGWGLIDRHIHFLKEACDRDGVALLVTYAPVAAQVYEGRRHGVFFSDGKASTPWAPRLRSLANVLGVPFVDLVAPLKRARGRLYYETDGHWTPAGHAVVAETLYAPLVRLLQGRAPAGSAAVGPAHATGHPGTRTVGRRVPSAPPTPRPEGRGSVAP